MTQEPCSPPNLSVRTKSGFRQCDNNRYQGFALPRVERDYADDPRPGHDNRTGNRRMNFPSSMTGTWFVVPLLAPT